MKTFFGAVLRAFGYLLVILALFGAGVSTASGGGERSGLGTLYVLGMASAAAISRGRTLVFTKKYRPRAATKSGLLARVVGRVALGWLGVVAPTVLLAYGSEGVAGAAASAGAAIVVVGCGLLASVHIPWRVAGVDQPGVNAVGQEDGGRPTPVVCEPGPSAKAGVGTENWKTNAAAVISILVFALAMWGLYRYANRTQNGVSESTPVQIVALNDTLTRTPADEMRHDTVHALVIVGQSWVTFDGGWRNSKEGEAAALRLAVFEAKRRGGTSIHLGIRPCYDRGLGFFVYESAKVYEPNGTFIYSK
ncbi:MAG: hypothetical protein NTV51_12925 [Verrucomicrobia bacterium]|nr:hypothetical protein [Verrucomicrobiota bacterium]